MKQLRTRQSSVDSQLSAMKQENAVLWRELAMLRQKHIKQQQIVNKVKSATQICGSVSNVDLKFLVDSIFGYFGTTFNRI